MRVLLALSRDDVNAGGSLRVAQTLGEGLKALGIDAEISFAYGGLGPIGRKASIPCHYLGLRSSKDLFRWVRFRRFLKSHRPDVVHFIDPVIAMQLATTGMSLKTVVHVHGRLLRNPLPWKELFARILLRSKTDKFVCISKGVQRDLIMRRLVTEDQVVTVYNGIDFHWFQCQPTTKAARRQLELPADALVIGMVGRLFKARGFDDLLRILTMLSPNWYALLVGDGPERKNLENMAAEFGIFNRVRFTGSLDDVRVAYSAMDAFAFLPLYDSFGLATAEAMSSRVPVFGLDRPGEYREPENPLVTDDNAIFVRNSTRRFYEDSEDKGILQTLAGHIEAYGKKPSDSDSILNNAWNHIQERFTRDTQAAKMIDVYESVLVQKPGRETLS